MSQNWSVAQNNQGSKAIDLALVIAGWPSVYTVARSYTLPSSGSLSGLGGSGFDSVTQPWASVSDIAGPMTDGRPEEGFRSTTRLEIEILDRVSGGRRELSDLAARDSLDLPGTKLTGSIGPGDLEVPVASVAGFDQSGGFAFVGTECIRYGGTSDVGGPKLTSCIRGQRLSIALSHLTGTAVHPEFETLKWRRAILFKGYQDLALDEWVPAFTGLVARITKVGPRVTLSLCDVLWMTDGDGGQRLLHGNIVRSGRVSNAGRYFHLDGVVPQADVDKFPDLWLSIDDPEHRVANGHYLVGSTGSWAGISGEITFPNAFYEE